MKAAWTRLHTLGRDYTPTEDCLARQTRWLHATLQNAANTNYGGRHGFASILTPSEYQRRVPLVDYDDLAPLIDQVATGESDVLFSGRAVAFERTGGGRQGGKLIPYSEGSLRDFRRALLPWIADVAEDHALSGPAYWAISPPARAPETTAGGIPIGLPDSAYFGSEAAEAFVALSAVPFSVGGVTAVAEWRIETLAALINRPDLELVSVWSPTFLLMLLDSIPPSAAVLTELLGSDARARLKDFLSGAGATALWPRLKLVSCWADAASRPYCERLRDLFPNVAFQPKGLLATEGVVTVPNRDGLPVLAADCGFFEFLDHHGRPWLSDQLVDGESYEVVTTTSGGLYRYRTGDRVRHEGTANGLPVLRFLGRCGDASDLVGEKLTDDFVETCLDRIPGFRMIIPLPGDRPGYALIVDRGAKHDGEALRAEAESRLCSNPQYAAARRFGQLDALTLRPVVNPLENYIARQASRGGRLGDVKLRALATENDWPTTFGIAS